MKLARREKYIAILAGGILLIILLLEILILPFFENREQFQRGIKSGERQLEKLQSWAETRSDINTASIDIDEVISKRDKNFTLFSFMDRATESSKIPKDRRKHMKPSETKGPDNYTQSTVEIKFEGITIDQLSEFLYQIEAPEDLIFVKRITISDTKDREGYLDCTIQASTYK